MKHLPKQALLSLIVGAQAFIFFIMGYVLEFIYYYAPCVLCFIQRFIFLGIGVLMLLSVVVYKKFYLSLLVKLSAFIFTIMGTALAVYHINLQSKPVEQITSCSQSISLMLDNFEFGRIIDSLLRGDSECYIIQKWLGINLTHWSLLLFVLLLLQMVGTIKKVDPSTLK